jgi:hypothetical protein
VEIGKFGEAVEPLTLAVSFEPRNWRLRSLLAYALYESGNVPGAREQYHEITHLEPLWKETLNQEAWLMLGRHDSTHRDGHRALLLATLLCQATANREARYLDTLAAAHAETADFARAIEAAKQAIAVASAGPEDDLVKEIRMRLQLYEKKQPLRK